MTRFDEWSLGAALFLLGSAPFALDLTDDLARNAPAAHVARQASFLLPWLIVLAWIAAKLVASRRTSRRLSTELEAARSDLERARADASALARGVGEAITRQLDEWRLTPSEREVAHLLLKGLGHREIARLRQTSEKTVRQQAASLYQKAGLAGRAELSAFFLEDLLVLPETASA